MSPEDRLNGKNEIRAINTAGIIGWPKEKVEATETEARKRGFHPRHGTLRGRKEVETTIPNETRIHQPITKMATTDHVPTDYLQTQTSTQVLCLDSTVL